MGGLCSEGHEFLRLCKKRNKSATLHLLDVLVTQHAKWTAKRVRRGLFGQAIVDFSTASWSSIQLKDSAKPPEPEGKGKKTPRILRTFAQKRIVAEKVVPDREQPQFSVPGMSAYESQEDNAVHFDISSHTSDVESESEVSGARITSPAGR